MINYLICSLFFCASIAYLFLLGLSLTKDIKNLSKNVIIGFIFYSFITSFFLLIIQLFKLPWVFALYVVILTIILLGIFICMCLRRNKTLISKENIVALLKNNYFLFVIVFILFGIYLLQFDLIWINNHLDDGYYLTKIATLPYLDNPFITNYSTGLLNLSESFDAYLLSSYETHASIYRYLLNIDPVIFCRFFLNVFNYFLAACTVTWFTKELNKKMSYKLSDRNIQYCSMVLMIFAFEYTFLSKTGLLDVQDSWQFSSAMWFGSSIPRVLGLLWLITPFVNCKKIKLVDFFYVMVCSFVLISCSSIALPIIFFAGVSYLIAFSLTSDQKNIQLFTVFVISIVILAGWILPNDEGSNLIILTHMAQNIKSVLFLGCIGVTLLSFFIFKNLYIKRMVIMIVTCFFLMLVPEVNDFFEKVSIYNFVFARAQTCIIYTFIIFSFIMYVFIFNTLLRKKIKLLMGISLALLCSLCMLSVVCVYGNPLYLYKIMLNNPYLMPNSTIMLSKQLQSTAEKYGNNINVLTPEWVFPDNHRHSLAVMIRTYAPSVNSISAIGRYGVTKGNDFSGFTNEDYSIYNNFCQTQNANTVDDFKQLLNSYPINCLVFTNDIFNDYMNEFGYTFEKKVDNYYIYIENSF